MLKIGLAQFSVQPGNAEANTEKMKQYIERAKKNKCHLIIFPELAIPGYFIGDNWDQPDYMTECVRCGEEIRALSDNITVIYGNVAIEADKTNPDGRPRKYNAMFIAQKGKFISPGRSPYPFYIKTLLPNYREFNDLRHFTSLTEVAQERHVFPEDFLSPVKLDFGSAGTLTAGPLICEDSWDENYAFKPMTCLSDMYDLDMFINISNSPFTLGKTERRNRLFKKAVEKFKRPVIYVNCTGIQNNGKNIYTFDGTSGVYDKTGSLCRSCPSFEEDLAFVTYESESRSFSDTLPPAYTEKNETAEIFTSLQYGIRSFLEQIGMKKVVIGVSGGIDSAVNAALYASVLKPENLLLVNMPSRYNSETTKDLARQLADNIGCLYTVIPVQDSLELTKKQFAAAAVTCGNKVLPPLELTSFMEENIQARDRSSRILAAAAAAVGGVFTCNANKAESTVGYATLYGDGAGFLAATADLWKYQIYALAGYLNEFVFKREVVPRGSIDIIPSAELSAGQDIAKGQGDPLIYPYHDRLFAAFTERWQRAAPETILRWYSEGRLAEKLGTPVKIDELFPNTAAFIADLERWWNLFSGFAVAKRIQSPPILSVSRRSFGNDLRESQLRPYYTREYKRLKENLLHK